HVPESRNEYATRSFDWLGAGGVALAADRQGHDPRAEPVEGAGGVLVAALRDVTPRRPRGDGDQWDIDEKGGAPRNGVHEQAAHQGAEDGRRARRAGPQAERAALLLARE